VAGFCEHGTEPSGSLKNGKFLDKHRKYWLIEKGSAPWRSSQLLRLYSVI
jgi:hypothetical protein